MVAATVVAGMGLLRVIDRTNQPSLSQTAVSLTLGGPGRPTPTPPITPSPTPASSASPTPVTSPVAVFNASSISGLATRTAALLRERGVTIDAVANLAGSQKLAEGTVFYPPGQAAQARTLAHLIGAPAVAPAPSWIQANGRLVLVVTDSSTNIASTLPTHS